MPKACCCYVIDAGYLFPTLLSAMQARAAVPIEKADVTIFCVGRPTAETAPFSAICDQAKITLQFVPPAAIDNMPIMFARFFLARFLDPAYHAVLYIDGDTQIRGPLAPLLEAPLETGQFLAARDPLSILIDSPNRTWRARRAYFTSIGLAEGMMRRYCNSGVLRFNLADWDYICRAALKVSESHGDALRFPDQDALNLVYGDNYRLMSFRWNFPTFFLNFGFDSFIKPIVYHFMSNPRPWNGPFKPWGHAGHTPYLRLVDDYPDLQRFHRAFTGYKFVRYVAQQRMKSLLEPRKWNTSLVRERLMRLEAEAVV